MKVVFGALAVIILLIGAQSVFAQTGAPLSKHPQAAYKSGFNHGLTDGKNSCIRPGADQDKCDGNHDYVAQPGKGFINQTKEFINGYITAWCSVNLPGSGMDSDEAAFDCGKGPSSADWLIASSIDVPRYTPMPKHGASQYIEGWLDGWKTFDHGKSGNVGANHSPSYTVGFISGYYFGHRGYQFKKEYAGINDESIAGYRAQIDGKFPKEDCRHSMMQQSDFCFAYGHNVTGVIQQFEQLPRLPVDK